MRILALETNLEKLKESFASEGENLVMTIHYSWYMLLFSSLIQLCIAALLVAAGQIAVFYFHAPFVWVESTLGVLIILFVFVPLVQKYIHWHFSFIQLTSGKIIIVDQQFIFKQDITQMTLENFASVTAESQFWNIFPFGKLKFNLKEGTNDPAMRFIPHAKEVAEKIADVVSSFQRKKYVRIDAFPTP